jgi:alkylhydroperoxidase/carboxymuconolactone decarboxylase family protein YurZ
MAERPTRDENRWELGVDAYARQFHIPRDQVVARFEKRLGSRFGEEAIYSAGRSWQNDELSLRDRSLAILAALMTMGGTEPQLRSHARWAIEHGCTREEIEAMASLLAAYIGFVRASTALFVIREELAELEGR